MSTAPGATVTFWSQQTGGVQYTDLASAADGSGAMTQVTASSSDPGALPVFYGPNNIKLMWASANGGPRHAILANDIVEFAVATNEANTFTQPQSYGPTGNANHNRIILFAEETGQVGDVLVAWSGTDTGQGGARQRTMYLNEKGELRCIAAKTNSVAVRIKGQPGQTAHVLEQTDTSNNPVSWWEANGSWRAPNLGHVFAMSVAGSVAVGAGTHRIYNDTGVGLTIRSVRASVGTAPVGAAIRVDVNVNGTSIFTTQGNRPSIAAGSNTSGRVENMDVTSLPDGGYLTVDVDAIGSTTAGSDLTVQILAY